MIHGRYSWLTLICGGLLVLVGIFGIVFNFKNTLLILKQLSLKSFVNWNFAILILVATFFVIPIRPLSSQSFSLRIGNNVSILSSDQKKQIKERIKNGINTADFRFYDWVSAKYLGDNRIFKDKQFKEKGFVTDPTNQSFKISRFVISCCVVDATPVYFPVEYKLEKPLEKDTWVEIEGNFDIKIIDGESQPVIIATKVTKIAIPDDVYIK